MITFIITLFFVTINANFSEYLYKEGRFSELENFNSYIKNFENEKPFFNCSTEAVIVTNLINISHKNLFNSFYTISNSDASIARATNIFEALDKNHNPSSLHYAFLLAEALKVKNYNVKFFKLFDHFGIYYKYKDSKEAVYWSILSHKLEGGFVNSAGCFVDIFNEEKNPLIDGDSCAISEDLVLVDDLMSYIEDQVIFYKKSLAADNITPKQEDLVISEYIDNPEVSVYFQGLEFIDKKLRTFVNSYVKADKEKINVCKEPTEGKIFLEFSIRDGKVIFYDEKNESTKSCLEDLFTTRMLPLIKDPYDVSIVGIF